MATGMAWKSIIEEWRGSITEEVISWACVCSEAIQRAYDLAM
jgi:hypothetical protein